MRQGRFEENECSLRMKIDMTHENPNMRDPVAYRIRYVPHPHAGDKWCIYPTYDYTHCINDSLENITHSLCTLEFENRRESYYWLLEALDLYRPIVWEYSRLNLTYTVLSKRKLEKLVLKGVVSGWEDPRMPTMLGLRRRGYTPSMINDFAGEIGVSRKGNENITSIKLLEFYARRELDRDAPRTFGVQDPILLDIVNYEELAAFDFEAPLFPSDKTRGTQIYHLGKHVFID
jgi:glutaminyl-tRNA synthetase